MKLYPTVSLMIFVIFFNFYFVQNVNLQNKKFKSDPNNNFQNSTINEMNSYSNKGKLNSTKLKANTNKSLKKNYVSPNKNKKSQIFEEMYEVFLNINK